ncbi:hypothetical protein ACQB60_35280 [Actinomycetota bacterium Odt1-20B]
MTGEEALAALGVDPAALEPAPAPTPRNAAAWVRLGPPCPVP